jgi:hypothetical protein
MKQSEPNACMDLIYRDVYDASVTSKTPSGYEAASLLVRFGVNDVTGEVSIWLYPDDPPVRIRRIDAVSLAIFLLYHTQDIEG